MSWLPWATLAATAGAAFLLEHVRLRASRRRIQDLHLALAQAQKEKEEAELALVGAQKERRAERTGRIRAEKELRQLVQLSQASGASLVPEASVQGQLGNMAPSTVHASEPLSRQLGVTCEQGPIVARTLQNGISRQDGGALEGVRHSEEVLGERRQETDSDAKNAQDVERATSAANEQQPPGLLRYPMAPIGTVHSCFMTRNGTPRQPLLVKKALARVELAPTVPPSALEGLEDFSHVWILFIFHANTDMARLWDPRPHAKLQAKIRVPRLNGGKRGCLATRSPHRPLPLGLSVAKVERVEGRSLLISGTDIVDGTPVLDLKPYLPYSDSISEASAPIWAQAADGPLEVSEVSFEDGVESQLERILDSRPAKALFQDWRELKGLAHEVLSRDIRSAWQRSHGTGASSAGVDAEHSEYLEGNSQSGMKVTGPGDTAVRCQNVIYHVLLDGIDFSYTIQKRNVHVISACKALQNDDNVGTIG